MFKKLTRFGVIGASLATAATLGLGGVAAADSISVTGPGSVNIISSNTGGNFFGNNKIFGSNNCLHPAVFTSFKNKHVNLAFNNKHHKHHHNNNVAFIGGAGFGTFFNNFGGFGNNSINFTGPHSTNIISSFFNRNVRVTNTNNVGVNNFNSQFAMSGNANVSDNTFGGNAITGNASNRNNTNTNVAISNGGSNFSNFGGFSGGSNSIGVTGPHSTNIITASQQSSVRQTNTNNVSVNNNNSQSATTGNANVSDNTFGGSAVTGNASNSNTTSTNVAVTNSGSNFSGGSSFGGGSNSIGVTGPGSFNSISSSNRNSFSTTNTNNVSVNNSSSQSARSGNANVSDNTFGGSAVTGWASNSNQVATTVDLHN